MKGIVLAGGLGTRLDPLTRVTNKHLLPIFDKPMIYYPIQSLVNAGIDEIMVVTGGNSAGDFLKLLRNGKDFGLKDLHYTYQSGNGGIADALSLAEHFADNNPVCVVLGDNIIENNIRHAVEHYHASKKEAQIIIKEVTDPERFGVPVFADDQKTILKIEEKPQKPKSNYAVIGIYFYNASVFDFIKNLKPSQRGELEISDVNNMYIDRNEMTSVKLDGWWTDAGTFDSLLKAGQLVGETGANKT